MKAKNTACRILSFLFGAGLLCFWVVFCIQTTVFDHSFYTRLYEKLQITESADASQEDINKAIFAMTDYVEGKRDDLVEEIVWRGESREAFNEKETSHMKDVRTLWQNAHHISIIGGLAALVFACVILFLQRKDGIGFLCRGYLQALGCFAVILAFFGCWALVDFSGFWVEFHHIFFSNQLWLLDPTTDFMIVICPEQMFSTMIADIVIKALSGMIVLAGFSWYWLKKKAKIGI